MQIIIKIGTLQLRWACTETNYVVFFALYRAVHKSVKHVRKLADATVERRQ